MVSPLLTEGIKDDSWRLYHPSLSIRELLSLLLQLRRLSICLFLLPFCGLLPLGEDRGLLLSLIVSFSSVLL